jgi:hypothetical protein
VEGPAVNWPALDDLLNATPLLPDALTLRLAMPVAWAIVLAFLVLFWGQKMPLRRTGLVALAVAVWALVPGAASPAYWLGLAFQIPSLTTALICLGGLVALVRRGLSADQITQINQATQSTQVTQATKVAQPIGASELVLNLMAIALGWLLLLDTLAVWPFALYHWGFSPITLAVAALLAAIFWVIAGGTTVAKRQSLLLMAVLALFVLLRLPTGNLFDALIDPWLWLVLQWRWMTVLWARLRLELKARTKAGQA